MNPWPFHASVSCPHCCSLSVSGRPTCHLCQGRRQVAADTALAYTLNIWAKRGCICGACLLIGPMPQSEAADTFREAFAQR